MEHLSLDGKPQISVANLIEWINISVVVKKMNILLIMYRLYASNEMIVLDFIG